MAPSLRYWPRLSSTLPGDELRYTNQLSGQEERHQALEVGVANTPWIINISVGYSLGW
ncbi:MAG: hypothetical protein HC842_04025 [Cytophagales bacterium]|nr:hypothetical protein [Cytophagales bacterium]